jgi:TolB protein
VERDPARSPDGAWRAESAAPGGDEEIVLRGPEGAVRRVTREPGRDAEPAWSPDGSRLAFISERDGDPEVYVANLETLRVIRLTHEPGPERTPRWSRDSSTVFFVSERDGRPQIYRVGRLRTGLRRVSDGTADDELR